MGEQPRLRGERLHGDPDLAERALGEAGRSPRPSVSPVSGWRSFTDRSAALESRRECEPREVECGRERLDLEVADRDQPALVDEDERVRLGRVELDRELRATKPNASRAAPFIWASVRKLSGSCSARGSTSLPRAARCRRASVDLSPG